MEHLLQSMSDAGLKPTVVDLGQQYYDESFPGKPGTEGALVLTNTAPFEEADRNPALQVYLKWLKKASPSTPPTTLGVQAFSRGPVVRSGGERVGLQPDPRRADPRAEAHQALGRRRPAGAGRSR